MIIKNKAQLAEAVGHDQFSIGSNFCIECASVRIESGTAIGNELQFSGKQLVLGRKCTLGDNLRIHVLEEFVTGAQTVISSDCAWDCRSFVAGDNNYIGGRTVFGNRAGLNAKSVFRMGTFCHVGYACYFDLKCSITFKNDVAIGPQSVFWTHGAGLPPILGYPQVFGDILCEDFVWLPYHVTVMPGVTIGTNVVSASCAMITQSVAANKLVAGIPAVVKREFAPREMSESARYRLIGDRMTNFLEYAVLDGCTVEQVSPVEAVVGFKGSHHRVFWGDEPHRLACHKDTAGNVIIGTVGRLNPDWACAVLIADARVYTANESNRAFVEFLVCFLRGDGVGLKELLR
jgi:acetyltransferase-like isoleucine patch superfamily enzyme